MVEGFSLLRPCPFHCLRWRRVRLLDRQLPQLPAPLPRAPMLADPVLLLDQHNRREIRHLFLGLEAKRRSQHIYDMDMVIVDDHFTQTGSGQT